MLASAVLKQHAAPEFRGERLASDRTVAFGGPWLGAVDRTFTADELLRCRILRCWWRFMPVSPAGTAAVVAAQRDASALGMLSLGAAMGYASDLVEGTPHGLRALGMALLLLIFCTALRVTCSSEAEPPKARWQRWRFCCSACFDLDHAFCRRGSRSVGERTAQPADAARADRRDGAAGLICAKPHRRSAAVQSDRAGAVDMKLFRRQRLHFDLRIGIGSSLAPSGVTAGQAQTASLRSAAAGPGRGGFVGVGLCRTGGTAGAAPGPARRRLSAKSTSNFIRERELPSVRGQIRDRRGEVLADNRPTFAVYATPRYVSEATLLRLGRLLKLTEEQREALSKN